MLRTDIVLVKMTGDGVYGGVEGECPEAAAWSLVSAMRGRTHDGSEKPGAVVEISPRFIFLCFFRISVTIVLL